MTPPVISVSFSNIRKTYWLPLMTQYSINNYEFHNWLVIQNQPINHHLMTKIPAPNAWIIIITNHYQTWLSIVHQFICYWPITMVHLWFTYHYHIWLTKAHGFKPLMLVNGTQVSQRYPHQAVNQPGGWKFPESNHPKLITFSRRWSPPKSPKVGHLINHY